MGTNRLIKNTVITDINPHTKHRAWLTLVDLNTLTASDLVLGNLYADLKHGYIPIVASPSLSDHTAETNQCADIIDIVINDNRIDVLLEPRGNKKHVFRTMLQEGLPLKASVIGNISFHSDSFKQKVIAQLEHIHYIRLDFTR